MNAVLSAICALLAMFGKLYGCMWYYYYLSISKKHQESDKNQALARSVDSLFMLHAVKHHWAYGTPAFKHVPGLKEMVLNVRKKMEPQVELFKPRNQPTN